VDPRPSQLPLDAEELDVDRVAVDDEGAAADPLAAEPHIMPLTDRGSNHGVAAGGRRAPEHAPDGAVAGMAMPGRRLGPGCDGSPVVSEG
jgi:hypothetical protein